MYNFFLEIYSIAICLKNFLNTKILYIYELLYFILYMKFIYNM